MTWGERLLWFFLGMNASAVVLNLWRTRDVLRDSARQPKPEKEQADAE